MSQYLHHAIAGGGRIGFRRRSRRLWDKQITGRIANFLVDLGLLLLITWGSASFSTISHDREADGPRGAWGRSEPVWRRWGWRSWRDAAIEVCQGVKYGALQLFSFSCSSSYPTDCYRWRGGDEVNDRPVGKPQEEGMMNIAASFFLSKKPRFVDPVGKSQYSWRWCLLASRQLWTIYRAPRPSFALPAATWNLHTTQPNTLFPTYDEVVNLTGLLETKEWAYRVESNSNMRVK
jgi:hypothetical protein